MARLGNSELDVFPLSLGTNIYGWTADESDLFSVFDAYVERGGNFVDTADEQPRFVHDGTTEVMLGNWIKARGNRDRVVLATKGGKYPGLEGLSADTIRRSLDASLQRLQTDYVDLYYAHRDDPETPLQETLATYDALIKEGKIRYIGACEYTAPRLSEALAISDRENLAKFVVYQPTYNLMDRRYEAEQREVVEREGLACVAAWSLARGFLTGKYRSDGSEPDTKRGDAAMSYLDQRGERTLEALDEIAAARRIPVSMLAIAWLREQPTVVSVLGSARTPQQLTENLNALSIMINPDEVEQLSAASALQVA
jgi:aryl-alcohol dehydrogenase-like predicted oxidoreductase